MKLNYRTDICLFVMFCALMINSISAESELLTKELIDQLGPGQTDYQTGVIEKFDTMPHLVPKTVFTPPMLKQLLKGHTMIFGVDDPERELQEDSVLVFENSFIVYRDIKCKERIGRIAFDIRQFGWKCGSKNVCPVQDLLANIKPEEIDVGALKTQYANFLIKIRGNNKVCHGDTYYDKVASKNKALIVCFNNQEDMDKLKESFEKLNPKDLPAPTEKIDTLLEKTYTVFFTDGLEAFVKKTLTFKAEGIYEGDKLLFNYSYIEPMDKNKCEVYHHLPIFPLKFLENNILASKCLLKFKYDRMETFMGSMEKDCEEITKYIAAKMKDGCLNYISGPAKKFTRAFKTIPEKGEWKGTIFYHKLDASGAAGTVDNNPYEFEVNTNNIKVQSMEKKNIKSQIEFIDIKWACNDLGECNFWEYINYLKRLNPKEYRQSIISFENVVKQIREKWGINDVNHCFVIDANEAHVICPRDPSEEVNIRTAVSVAIDKKLVDEKIETFKMNDLKDEYFISYVSESNPFVSETTVRIGKEKLFKTENHKEADTLIDFKMIKDISDVPCAFEFRHLALPPAFHEFNPLCCAKYITDETNYFCIQNQAKCYIQLRRMLVTMQERCYIAKGLKKDKYNGKGWKGKIAYNEIDNYKFKGEVNNKRGILTVTPENILITDNNKEKPQNFKIEHSTLKFNCLSDLMCSIDGYKSNQEPFLQKGYDREWQESTFTKFMIANKDIREDDCMVITSENEEMDISQMILVCTEEKEEGIKLKESISDFYNRKLIKMDEKHPEFKKIPSAHEYSNYHAYIINSDPSGKEFKDPTNISNIVYNNNNIISKDSGMTLIKYDKIMDVATKKINLFWKSPLKNAPKDKLKQINPDYCLAASMEDTVVINICMTNKKKGLYEKASLFQSVLGRAKFIMGQAIKNQEYDEYLRTAKPYDPFEFGVQPNYKKFPKTFNTDTLAEDTFEVSKNGIWEGWVYEGTLTERNFKKIFTPVYMQLSHGYITFRTDNNVSPYKILKVQEYDQVCKGHCKPDEYTKWYRQTKDDVDDLMYLEDSIQNYLGQMKYPYINEGCVIMDFMSPIFQFGQQHMVCAVDKTQGQKIRLAIDNVYYTSLLNLDMEKGVRRPNTHTDRYWARLIINDEINEGFNNFYVDEYGLVGRSMKERLGFFIEEQNKQVFNVTYASIDKDNFGRTCAFWYKNQKIKQRNDRFKNTISDNNCCFKFYTKKDRKKIELCTFTLDNRICIKQARELMKGIKSGCIDNEETNSLPDNHDDNEKDTPIDMYIENTIDNHENGFFEGFAHFANAVNSSQQPRSNPYFIRVGKFAIEIFNAVGDVKPKYFIDLDNMKFSCKGQNSCNPADFLKYAQTHKQYIPLLNSVNTIFNLFKDTFSIQEKSFNENCFVLETVKIPILICPFKPEHGQIIRKAVSNAFKLKFLRQKIFAIPNPTETRSYKIIYKKGLTETTDTVELKTDGLFSVTSKTNIFHYTSIDDDPVTKSSCAIWYKSLRPGENKNETPKEDLLKKSCCIRFLVKGNISHICVDKPDGICVDDIFTIMKSVYNGCKYSNPAVEKIPRSPDSEILGQKGYKPVIKFDSSKERYEILPKERQKPIFPYAQIKRKFFLDTYNEISFSKRRSLYQGWVNVYPLPIDGEPKFQILKYYAKISPESFQFFETSKDKAEVKLSIRPDMISSTCRESSCKVYEYLEKFLSKFDKKFEFKKNYYRAKFSFYEMGKEDGCAVIENHIDNEPKYYIICPRFTYLRTMSRTIQPIIDNPKSSNKKNRILLSATYGKVLRDIIFNAHMTARKFVKVDQINDLKGEVIHAKVSQLFKYQEHANVTVSNEGITASKNLLIKFDDLPNCMINFNLVYAPDFMYTFEKRKVYNMKKQTCCVRYSGPTTQEYVCFGDLNCEYVTYKFAHLFNKKCMAKKKRKNDDVYNEMNAGNNVSLKPLIKRAFKEELKITCLDMFRGSSISTDDNIIKQKSLIIKYMYEIRDIMHELNKIDIHTSIKIKKGKEDSTLPDPIAKAFTKFEPRYVGYTKNKDWDITAAKNRITKYESKKRNYEIYIVGNDQYIKTKTYTAIIGLKSKYFAIRYNDGEKIKVLAEIDEEFRILEDKKWMNPEIKEKSTPILKMLNIKLD